MVIKRQRFETFEELKAAAEHYAGLGFVAEVRGSTALSDNELTVNALYDDEDLKPYFGFGIVWDGR